MTKADSNYRDGAGSPGDPERQDAIAAPGSAGTKLSWRSAINNVAMPALRLHRLRNIRTRMLYDALGDVDRRQC